MPVALAVLSLGYWNRDISIVWAQYRDRCASHPETPGYKAGFISALYTPAAPRATACHVDVQVHAMGSSTAVKVALLATCLLVQHALAQRGGGGMVGSGSGSSEEESGRGGRGARAGRGSGSSDSSSNNNIAMTLGSEIPISPSMC